MTSLNVLFYVPTNSMCNSLQPMKQQWYRNVLNVGIIFLEIFAVDEVHLMGSTPYRGYDSTLFIRDLILCEYACLQAGVQFSIHIKMFFLSMHISMKAFFNGRKIRLIYCTRILTAFFSSTAPTLSPDSYLNFFKRKFESTKISEFQGREDQNLEYAETIFVVKLELVSLSVPQAFFTEKLSLDNPFQCTIIPLNEYYL